VPDARAIEVSYMDIAVDNTVVSRLDEDSALLTAVEAKLAATGARLVVSYPVLYETLATSNFARAAGRARILASLAANLGTRFVFAGEFSRIIKAEWTSPRNSTLSVEPHDSRRMIEVLSAPELQARLPAMVPELQRHLLKEKTLDNDRRARSKAKQAISNAQPNEPDKFLRGLRTRDEFWATPSVDIVTGQGVYLQRIREVPHRYPAALTFAVYSFLLSMGAIYGDIGYGRLAGILRAPHKGDWVDAQIVTCAAYCRFFLTEDSGQQMRIGWAAKEFPLRTRAISVREWLSMD
jgi:hypothetical protein